MSDAYDDFMGGGAKTFPFENIGDQVTGTIIEVQRRQQTDIQTGEPKTWSNGEPRFMYNIQLQTNLREDEFDDGVRAINVKWNSQRAVQDAVRRAGAKRLERGGELTLKYTGNGPRGNFPQPPKLYAAHYVAPDMGDAFMSDGATASREPMNQTRDHHGNPQSNEPPDWARPASGASVSARPTSTLDSMRKAPADLPGDRAQYGY